MKYVIDYLMENKDKLNVKILDESKIHCRIQVFFQHTVTVETQDAQFLDVDSLIYNTKTKGILICQEDEHQIGYCYQQAIESIRYLDKDLKIITIFHWLKISNKKEDIKKYFEGDD